MNSSSARRARPLLDEQPVFLVGAARSGTTMLRLMLNRHPQIFIPEESHFIPKLVAALPTHGPLDRDEVHRALAIIESEPRIVDWHLNFQELRDCVSEDDRPTLSYIVRAVYSVKAIQEGLRPEAITAWGDKTPEYVTELLLILELFPKARFIHITRDGRDVSSSLRKYAWYGLTEYQRAKYWSQCVNSAMKASGHLPLGSYTQIRYEDVVLDPQKSLTDICILLDTRYEKTMVEFHTDARARITDTERASGVHEKLSRAPRSTDVFRWKRGAKRLQLDIFECVAGDALDSSGYELRHGVLARNVLRLGLAPYLTFCALLAMLHRSYLRQSDRRQQAFRSSKIFSSMKRTLLRM